MVWVRRLGGAVACGFRFSVSVNARDSVRRLESSNVLLAEKAFEGSNVPGKRLALGSAGVVNTHGYEHYGEIITGP